MTFKVLRDYCIFILAVTIFLSSCQLTTTGEKKSVLDEGLSTEEQAQSIDKDFTLEEPNQELVDALEKAERRITREKKEKEKSQLNK